MAIARRIAENVDIPSVHTFPFSSHKTLQTMQLCTSNVKFPSLAVASLQDYCRAIMPLCLHTEAAQKATCDLIASGLQLAYDFSELQVDEAYFNPKTGNIEVVVDDTYSVTPLDFAVIVLAAMYANVDSKAFVNIKL